MAGWGFGLGSSGARRGVGNGNNGGGADQGGDTSGSPSSQTHLCYFAVGLEERSG